MCDEKYNELISRYVDDDLNASEVKELEDHLNECEDCLKIYQDMKKIKESFKSVTKSTLDEIWYTEISKKIGKESLKKINYKRTLSYAAVLIAVMIIGGSLYNSIIPKLDQNSLSSTQESIPPSASDGSRTYDSAKNDLNLSSSSGSGTVDSNTDASVFDATKIIYSGNLSLHTDHYDSTITKISDYTKSIGGFVENSSVSVNKDTRYDYSNYGYVQIRVPSEKFEETMNIIKTYGEVQSENTNSVNITQSYRSIESELGSLRIQEAKLIEYLGKADKIADMLSIETELNRIRTEINYRVSMLQNYDTSIKYSTITIALYQKDLSTSSITSPFGHFFLSIKQAIISSINLILKIISFVIIWIFRLLPFAVIGLIIYIVIKKFKRKEIN